MTSPRRPGAFRPDEAEIDILPPPAEEETLEVGDALVPRPAALPPRRRLRLGRIFISALGGLVALALGLAVDRLISDLFARGDLLGWIGIALASLAGLAALAIAMREILGLLRLARIDKVREAAVHAADQDDRDEAGRVADALADIYRNRPDTAQGRKALAVQLSEVIDGRDLLLIAEGELLAPLDRDAAALVAGAAKRVSVVTAVSPRAAVDMIFVLIAVLTMIRRLARLYGGRPGVLGLARLSRQVIAHLAVTGGIAAGDGIVQQLIGHGIAAKVSARLGEGVVNGLLTARIGLAAIDVCRPLPFLAARRPGLSEVMGGIAGWTKSG